MGAAAPSPHHPTPAPTRPFLLPQQKTATPAFKQAGASFRQQAIDRVLGRLTIATTAAVETLIRLLAAEIPPGIRLSAAKAILDSLVNISSHADINERLAELEKRANGMK